MAASGQAGIGRPVPGGWRPVLSAALVVAFGALSRTDWALPGEATLAQRCTFVASLLAIGVRLWLKPSRTPRVSGCAARPRSPRPAGGGSQPATAP